MYKNVSIVYINSYSYTALLKAVISKQSTSKETDFSEMPIRMNGFLKHATI
jgi:hypothetical protein